METLDNRISGTIIKGMLYPVRSHRMSNVTSQQHGSEMLKFWAPAMERLDVTLSNNEPSRIIDIHMNELNADPVGTAVRIYDYFGMPVTEEARYAWQVFVDADARGGHCAHPVKAENVGLRADHVHAAMPNYYRGYRKRYPMKT